MRVAVSGASGFIGRYVLSSLIKKGIKPIALTRNKVKLAEFGNNIEIVELDISIQDQGILKKIGYPEVLIHLAWDGLPNYKSLHHFEIELPKQYFFLKTLFEEGLKKAFVAGTCFEYGMQSGELSPAMQTKPNNAYGYAKDALRKQLSFLQTQISFQMLWGRLFYMYGDGQSANSLYPQLKSAVESGEKMFNMSGGEQIRDYLHISEVAELIVTSCLEDFSSDCINICSGNPTTVRKLVEAWLKENHWDIQLNYGHYPYPDYEPMEFWGKKTETIKASNR
jgi:nucleoside-diphosphate-sugar epimerase